MTWLLDRNIDEGRGSQARLHRHRLATSPMASCSSRAASVANLLRRLGVRREERVAMIMLDTVDFPVVFLGRDPRRHRAGAAQHAADLGPIRLRAGRLPGARAVHFRGAAARS